MALQNENGNYIRVNKEAVRQKLSDVLYHVFRDKGVRENPGEFDLISENDILVEIPEELVNQVVTDLYIRMKETEDFKNCIDI